MLEFVFNKLVDFGSRDQAPFTLFTVLLFATKARKMKNPERDIKKNRKQFKLSLIIC